MTSFTGPLIVKSIDSSVTAAIIERGGGATFTGPVTMASAVAVSGAMTFGDSGTVTFPAAAITLTSLAPVSALTQTIAQKPVIYASVDGSVMRVRGTIAVEVDGTTAYIPFLYGGS